MSPTVFSATTRYVSPLTHVGSVTLSTPPLVFGAARSLTIRCTSVHSPFTSFWTAKAVSLSEPSVQLNVVVPGSNASPVGALGGSASSTGRIMSISSWLRMWQW